MNRAFDQRLVIGIGLVVGLLIVNAGLTYQNTRQLNEDASSVAHTNEVLDALERVVSTMKDAETGQRGYIITGEPRYLAPYNAAVVAIKEKVERAKSLTSDNPGQQSHFPILQELITAKLHELDRTIAMRKKDIEAARQLILTDAGKQAMDAIRSQVAAMRQDERDLLHDRKQRSSRSYQVAVITSLLTTFLGLSLVGGFVYLLRRNLLERAKAAATIHEQREWFRTTLASIGDAVIVTDADGRVTFLNSVAQVLTGWKMDEASGLALDTVFKIVNEETRQTVEDPSVRALKEGRVVGLANHTLLLTKHGAELPIDDSASPIRNQMGDVVGVVLVFRDVTQRRRYEVDRERHAAIVEHRAQQLAEADRLKNEFLAMLAHELRNPLAPIRNALHLIRMQGPPRGESMTQPLAIIERQVEALVRLVDDLLDVSRITRGTIKLQKKPVEVAEIVARAVESSRPVIDARRHQLDVAMLGEPVFVEGDATRLAQVLLNLLNNAAKYTPEGGRISLTVESDRGEVAMHVRDNGMGIATDMLLKVFDLFAQSERTLDRGEGGLGIGLTLVRRLTEMHHGTVAAFSDGPSQGSEFVVRLPILFDRTPTISSVTRSPVREQVAALPKQRILVVDDNRDSGESLAMVLRLGGHEVHTTRDGEQALAMVETFRPDLVLLDIGLPGMDGHAVARRLRLQPEFARTVLVALTGYGNEEDRRQSQAAGFDHHMVKPVEFDALQELLAGLSSQ